MAVVRVKICGITRVQDAQAAAAAGADALGLVFYPPSPRHLKDLDLAAEICRAAGPFVTRVALFVNPDPAYVHQVLAAVPVNLLQFHGDETDAFCAAFNRPFIKALRMRPELDLESAMAAYPSAQGMLLDAYKTGVPGGTGETFDWARSPQQAKQHWILAGGLSALNLAQALEQAKPPAIDISGGLESAPGVKDPQKIAELFSLLRSV
jgi:phosphoribosylanthranilate isomerase